MSKAYYNENDPFAAAWLRELIKARLIADGDVDERSIEDVKPDELVGYTQCHFFAGVSGWSYALRLAGWGDDRECWTGSCPCQPFSNAGEKRGFDDARHLWPVFYRLIRECQPPVLFGEQIAGKAGLDWLDSVYADLEDASYTVGAADLCAASVGSPHPRQRLYFVGHSKRPRLSGSFDDPRVSSTTQTPLAERGDEITRAWRQLETSPTSLPSLDGVPLWLARRLLHGYGNAIVPQVAQAFIESYLEARKELGLA